MTLVLVAAAHHAGGPTPGEWDAIVIACFMAFILLVIYIPVILDWLRGG